MSECISLQSYVTLISPLCWQLWYLKKEQPYYVLVVMTFLEVLQRNLEWWRHLEYTCAKMYLLHVLCHTPKRFVEKTLVAQHKFAKFPKVFSLEYFLLYSGTYRKYSREIWYLCYCLFFLRHIRCRWSKSPFWVQANNDIFSRIIYIHNKISARWKGVHSWNYWSFGMFRINKAEIPKWP